MDDVDAALASRLVLALALVAAGAAAADHHAAGMAAFRAGRWDEARREFLAELDESPARPTARFNLASAEFKLGDYRDALVDYDAAAAADPRLGPLATLNAGLAADAAGLYDTAAAHYRAVADRADADEKLRAQASENLRQLDADLRAGRHDEAIALAHDGNEAVKDGRPGDAVALLLGALDLDRDHLLADGDRAEIEYALGNALLRTGEPRAAVEHVRRAVALSPGDAEFRLLLGVVLHQAGDEAAAIPELHAALAGGLDEEAAGRARETLSDALAGAAPRPSRFVVDSYVGGGYDSDYLGGRELVVHRQTHGMTSRSSETAGAPELVFDVAPRLRLAGGPGAALHAGARVDGLVYLTSAADPFSLLEGALDVDGTFSPLSWLTLGVVADAYADLSGVATASWYQSGASLGARAVALEGSSFATRLRYDHSFIASLDQSNYGYLSGMRDEVSLAELAYVGAWQLGAGYDFRREGVGVEIAPAAQILDGGTDLALRCIADLHHACTAADDPTALPDARYAIPWAYDGHELFVSADGTLPGALHVEANLAWQRRDYDGNVAITGTLDGRPGTALTAAAQRLWHKVRQDDRYTVELAVRRCVVWGIELRAALSVLVSTSNLDNSPGSTSPLDYDDKNFARVVTTLAALRSF